MNAAMREEPYLRWAIETEFAYLQTSHVRLLVEAKQSVAALNAAMQATSGLECLRLASAYSQAAMKPESNRFCTLDIVPSAAETTQSILIELFAGATSRALAFWSEVERAEVAACVAPQSRAAHFCAIPAAQNGQNFEQIAQKNSKNSGAFLGIIDVGLPILRADWRARLKRVWDQSLIAPRDASEGVAGFSYGRTFTPNAIANVDTPALADRWYADHDFPLSRRTFTHGAAVASVLAATETNSAEAMPMLAVQIAQPVLAHSSRIMLSSQILDALVWMIGEANLANGTSKLVVNISLGTQAGPHDGSSIFESAVDALIQQFTKNSEERLAIIFAAGNTYEARCHAELKVSPTQPATLDWFVPPDGVAPNSVELWFPPNTNDARVSLTAPDGRVIGGISFGSAGALTDDPGEVIAHVSVHHAGASAGGKDAMALLSLAPSFASGTAGTWKIQIESTQNISPIHAYVERANSMFDRAAPQGRQSRFVDAEYEIAGNHPGTLFDSPNAAIKRMGTLSSFGTGIKSVVVGASVGAKPAPIHARYSSAGPRRSQSGGKYVQQDFRPDVVAEGDESFAAPGLRVLGSQPLSVARMVGTSLAAPAVARAIAQAMHEGAFSGAARVWAQSHVTPNPIPNLISAHSALVGAGEFSSDFA
jgi:hypothetical protein